jgi:predicted aspartyl protease
MVDVRINGGASARLLLDTGADRTLISPRALAAAGVSLTRPVASGRLSGVTGSDRIDYVIIDALEVGEARATRMPVAAYEMTLSRGDGLLGRDFLDRFNVSIDARRGEVILAPK